MTAIMNKRMERSKLLAAIVAFAMVVCAIAIVIPSSEADGVNSFTGDGYSIEVPGYDNITFAADESKVNATGYAGIASPTEIILGTESTFASNFGTAGTGFGYAILKLDIPAGVETVTVKQTNSALAGYVSPVDERVEQVDGKYVKTNNDVAVADIANGAAFLIPKDGSAVVFEFTYGENSKTVTIDFTKTVTASVIDSPEDISGIVDGVLTLTEDTTWIINGAVSVDTIKTVNLDGNDLTIADSAAGGSLTIKGSADANLIIAQNASTQATLKVDGATLSLFSFTDAKQMLINTQGTGKGMVISGVNGATINMNKTGTSSMIGTGSGNTVIDLNASTMTITGNGGVQAVLVKAVDSTIDASAIGKASFAGYFDLDGSKVIASNVNAYATDLVDSEITASGNLGIYTGDNSSPFTDSDMTAGTVKIDKDSAVTADKIYDCIYDAADPKDPAKIGKTATITGEGTLSGDLVSNTTGSTSVASNFTMDGITLQDSDISGEVSVTIPDEKKINVAGDITGEGSVTGGKIALQDNATISVKMTDTVITAPSSNPNDPAFDFDDAPTVTINGVTYSVIHVIFDDTNNCDFGITVKDVEYTGEPVRWGQINPQSSNLNNTNVTATLYKDDYQFVERNEDGTYSVVESAPSTVGTHYIRLTVNVNYNNGNSQQNLNVEVVVPFEITRLDTSAGVSLEPWDVKTDYNDPVVEYKYTDENGVEQTITNLEDLPCEYSIYLTDADGNRYDYPGQWTSEALMFEGESKTFTLHAEFGQWGVYEACEAPETSVTLVNETDAASELTFGAPADGTTYYDVSVDRLQDGVTISDISPVFDSKTYAYTSTITGTVFELSSYPDFWVSADADKAGYYIAFTVTPDDKVDWANAVLKITNPAGVTTEFSSAVNKVFDGYFVLYLGETIPTTDPVYTIAYDQDGNEGFFKETTYTLTIDASASEWYYGIWLYDEGNASYDQQTHELLYATAAEGAFITLPNKADVNSGFLGWESPVTGDIFDAGSTFVVSEKYADVNGKIVLKANYGEPVDEVITHTVTFVVDENTSYAVTVIDGQPVAQPFAPYVEGMTFVGWNNGNDAYDFTTAVTGNLTLTAQFEPVSVEYSTDVVVGFLKGEDGLTITFTAKDGKEIPVGALTINYMYLAYNEDLGMIMPTPGSFTYEGGIAAGTTYVEIPADDIVGYDYMTQMTVVFEIEGDSFENYGPLSAAIPEVPTA